MNSMNIGTSQNNHLQIILVACGIILMHIALVMALANITPAKLPLKKPTPKPISVSFVQPKPPPKVEKPIKKVTVKKTKTAVASKPKPPKRAIKPVVPKTANIAPQKKQPIKKQPPKQTKKRIKPVAPKKPVPTPPPKQITTTTTSTKPQKTVAPPPQTKVKPTTTKSSTTASSTKNNGKNSNPKPPAPKKPKNNNGSGNNNSKQNTINQLKAMGSKVIKAKFKFKAEAKYPKREEKAGKKGRVLLSFTIDKNTEKAKNIKVLKSNGKSFTKAAIKALKASTFRKTTKNGLSVDQKAQQQYDFGY